MKVSVIIPAFRLVSQDVLDAVSRQSYKNVEVIVVKGVSPNGKARNKGAADATGEILLFLDDDAIMAGADVIERLVTPIQRGDAAIVGASRVLPEEANWFARTAARQIPLIETPVVSELTPANPALTRTSVLRQIFSNPRSIFNGSFDQATWAPVTTTCMAIRRDAFDQIGGFREDIPWGVDTEFFYRATKIGVRMALAPQAVVWHPYVSNMKQLWTKYYKSGRGMAAEMQLNPERQIQPPLDTWYRTLVFVLYRLVGAFVFLFIKPFRAFSSLFAATGYIAGWLEQDVSSGLAYVFLGMAVVVSPLTRLGTIEVGFTVKLTEVFLIVATAAYVLGKIRQVSLGSIAKGVRNDPLVLILLGYNMVAVASLVYAINPFRGLVIIAQTNIFMFGLLYFPAHYLNLHRIIDLVKTYVFAVVAASVFGLFQFFTNYLGFNFGLRDVYVKARTGYPRIQSTMLEPLYLAHYMHAAIALVGSSLLFNGGFIRKWRVPIFTLLTLVMALSFSRGGWLSYGVTAICLGVSVLVVPKRLGGNSVVWKNVMHLGMAALFGLLLTPVSLSIGQKMYSEYGVHLEETKRLEALAAQQYDMEEESGTVGDEQDEEALLSELGDAETTTNRITNQQGHSFVSSRLDTFFKVAVGERLSAWDNAWAYFTASPLIGIGVGNFGYLEQNQSDGLGGVNFVNNQPLEILAETGLIGFMFFVLLNAYVMWMFVRVFDHSGYDVKVLLVGLGVGYVAIMAQFMTVSNWNVFQYWFVLGVVHWLWRDRVGIQK